MRLMLCRGKRKDNGEWVEGFIYEHQPPLQSIVPKDYIPEKSKWYICKTAFADWNMPRNVEFIEVIPETVGQYTGLTDKNGKQIFEGDIVKCTDINSNINFIAVIEFGNPNALYSWGWQLHNIKGDKPNNEILLWVEMEESGAYTEIFGNIHDNPELLQNNE